MFALTTCTTSTSAHIGGAVPLIRGRAKAADKRLIHARVAVRTASAARCRGIHHIATHMLQEYVVAL